MCSISQIPKWNQNNHISRRKCGPCLMYERFRTVPITEFFNTVTDHGPQTKGKWILFECLKILYSPFEMIQTVTRNWKGLLKQLESEILVWEIFPYGNIQQHIFSFNLDIRQHCIIFRQKCFQSVCTKIIRTNLTCWNPEAFADVSPCPASS